MPDDVEGGGGDGEGGRRKGKLKKISANTPMEIFSGLVAVVSTAVSITGIIMTGLKAIIIISGVVTSLFAGYSYYQQTRLTDIIALKETAEAVTREVDRLDGENVRLNQTVGKLSSTMDGLEDVEGALDVITQTQGASIETFRGQVEEHREILETLKKQLRASVMGNLLQVVISSDADGNNSIEEDEIGPLVERILKINGVEVMESKFRDMVISSGGSLSSVIDIIRNLTTGDGEGHDAVFKLKV